MKKKIPLSKLSIVAILFIMTLVSANLNWGKNYWKSIVVSDGKGYYAYLPALFIYHDLNYVFFTKIEKVDYFDKNLYFDYRYKSNGRVFNKFFCGTAIAELPFFLAAHTLSYFSGFQTDGYSKLYCIFINLAALFYLFIGLVYLNSALREYHIEEWGKSLVLFAAVFGTNLFYYTVREPGMSHVYSFAFISMFFCLAKQFFSRPRRHYIPLLFLVLGMIFLIRPINVLVIFLLPFAAGNYSTLKNGLHAAVREPWSLASGTLLLSVMISVQFIIYRISTGNFLVDAYPGEAFFLLHPHFPDILFRYRKGLFLYTPLYLLSLSGGFYLWKTSRFGFYSLFGFFILITYIFSSWWCWWYGGSFSSRVYVEFIPLFMILLALALNSARQKYLKTTFIVLIIMLTVLCQVQTYQYRYNQIHWSDMSKEKYWDVFLRIDKLIR